MLFTVISYERIDTYCCGYIRIVVYNTNNNILQNDILQGVCHSLNICTRRLESPSTYILRL